MQSVKRIIASLLLVVFAGMAFAQAEYRVQPGDVLVIEVLEDASLNRSVVVLPDGRFSFPFAGTLTAAGQNVGQLQTSITNAIQSNFATRPTVFVSVQPTFRNDTSNGGIAAGQAMDVYFVGEINNPGVVQVERGTTLLQAVAISGGVSRFAAIKRIQLRRTGADGVQRVTILNYKALADGAVTTDIELKDGDVILVPTRRLFE